MSKEVPISDKIMLTIEEAAALSNIGVHSIKSLVNDPRCDFVFHVGTKRLIKRKQFEQYIDSHMELA